MKPTKMLACLLLATVLTLSSLVALAEGPFVMSVMTQSYLAEYPSNDSEVLLQMQEYTNTKLEITWMYDAMAEKISTTLASGSDMPMAILATDVKPYYIVSAVLAGAFWELTPYLDEFPNLAEMYAEPVRASNASINGGTYGLYRKRPLSQNGIIFRKDWADKLGLGIPQTIDDYYEMLKAFTQQDPDGNGADDTYGLTLAVDGNSRIRGFDFLMAAFGAPNSWEWTGETMVRDFMTEEYMDCLRFHKKLYDEGLINVGFATNKEIYNDFNTSRSGSYINLMSNAGNHNNELFALTPTASIELAGSLEGPKGRRVMAESGFAGEYMFTTTGVKDEETLRKCLNFFDKLSDEPMQNLLRWGLEGKHFQFNEDGLPVRPAEWNTAYTNEVNCFRTFKLHYDEKAMQGVSEYAYQRARDLYVEIEQYAVANPVAPLSSETQLELGSDLDLIISDAIVRFIVGELNEDGFQAAVDEWRRQGGDRVIEEYTQAYLAAQH